MTSIPAIVSAPEAEYRAIRESAGVVDFSWRGVLRLAGPDGLDFLQGLVTSDLLKLDVGAGRSTAMLTPVGKIFAMLQVFRSGPDTLHLLLQAPDATRVSEQLEDYRFGEDVEIADVSSETAWLSLQGPLAPEAFARALGTTALVDDERLVACEVGGALVYVARFDEAGVPGLHVISRSEDRDDLQARLEAAAAEVGGAPVSHEAWTVCRVEAGVPWYGAELDEGVLPMDAGLQPILDTAKGCYVGQEVVARAMVQGRTNWGLWRLRLPPGSSVWPGWELVGGGRGRTLVRVRTVVRSPTTPGLVALAFVHREVARPGPAVFRGPEGDVDVVLEESEAVRAGVARR